MKKKKAVFIIFILLSLFSGNTLFAQSNYWVFLKDKKEVSFDPYEYFDSKAISRRLSVGISLYDSTDFPLNKNYVNSITSLCDTVIFASRWFNALAVRADLLQIEAIRELSFVTDIQPVYQYPVYASFNDDFDTIALISDSSLIRRQTETMGGNWFINNGIDGKGIRIAIFDGGFPTVDKNPVFEHIRKDKRILKTWDFTKNKEFVYGFNSHGTAVMSCIGGMINGKKLGLATGAEFLLARTEVNTEPYSEEFNWLAAVEWADKNGADIINSSLGYTYHRYFNNEMDGKTSLVSRAANLAARKGMLVVNAAGNDGDNKWKYIGTPADADSVLSVGGIDPETNFHISFSSFGPTSDKRMKPNVCAFGSVIVAKKTGLGASQGTSFSSPLVAGFAACAWQINKELTNMQLYLEIEKSASLYPYFDYAHGFGIPQAAYFFGARNNVEEPAFNIDIEDKELVVSILPAYLDEKQLFYYNIEGADGILKEYYVLSGNN
jgi:serine protease AprX